MPIVNPLPPDAVLQRVFDGCAFAEGPAADAAGNVYFSDCPNNRIMLYRTDGSTVVWKQPSQRANGMNFDAQGRLVPCCAGGPDLPGGARSVVRYEHDGSITTLASHYNGKPLNAPNDLCFDTHGRIYFTDPRYGDRSDLERDCMAVYRIELDGSLTRVIDDMETPNGILISADNHTFYLVDHNPNPGGARTLVAYDIDSSGSCKRRGVLHDYGSGYGGDGMTYLNTAAEGIPPLVVGEALAQYTRDHQLGMDGRERHYAQLDATKQLAARMFGLSAAETAICSCSSEAYNPAALALQLRPGDKVVINDLDFRPARRPGFSPAALRP